MCMDEMWGRSARAHRNLDSQREECGDGSRMLGPWQDSVYAGFATGGEYECDSPCNTSERRYTPQKDRWFLRASSD